MTIMFESDMEFSWKCTSALHIEESEKDSQKKGKMITGTLVLKGFANKDRHYFEADEIENISNTILKVPIHFGTGPRIDPNSGQLDTNMHLIEKEDEVGQLEKVELSEDRSKIKFWARVWNTPKNPHIEESVKEGWGVSIGGIAKGFKMMLNKAKDLAMRIFGMAVQQVSLLPPQTHRGQKEAKVEGVYVAESQMDFVIPKLNIEVEGSDILEVVRFL